MSFIIAISVFSTESQNWKQYQLSNAQISVLVPNGKKNIRYKKNFRPVAYFL